MNCQYWQWNFRGLVNDAWPKGRWERWTCAISKLGTFDESLPDGCCMPRRARIKVAGIPYHVIQRGNNRPPCFFAEEDYRFYL